MVETLIQTRIVVNQTPKSKWGLIVFFIASALLILFAPIPFPTPKPVDRLVHIDASSFQFTPGDIKVNPGDRVTIELVSTDVVHGISIDGYDFKLTSDPGQVATATFVATKPGVFRFRCSIACGNLHPFMIGKLKVGPNILLVRGILLGILSIIAAGYSMRKQIFKKDSIAQVVE